MQLTKSLLHTTDVYIKKLHEVGVDTVADFLSLFPKGYEDKSEVITRFSHLNIQEKQVVKCTIELVTSEMTRNKKLLIKAVLTDADGSHAEAVWFNQRLILSKFAKGDPVLLFGKPKYEYGRLSFPSAEIEHYREKRQEIMPSYSDVNYIPGTWIRDKMQLLRGYIENFADRIPEEIRVKKGLPHRREAIRDIHFPTSIEVFERARQVLGYEELFQFQLRGVEKKYELLRNSEGLAPATPLDAELVRRLIDGLPFALTDKQKIVLFQILKDMEKPHAMARLLQGDVGTGKTVVALIAAIHLILTSSPNPFSFREGELTPNSLSFRRGLGGGGIQVAIMAPTEILARQHFAGSEAWLMELGIQSDLLVGSLTPRMKEDARERLKNGQTDIIFGTHALIQDSVQFANLGFVVVDEQHRFGVEQRKALEEYVTSPQPSPKGEGVMSDDALGNIYELAKEMRKTPTETEEMVWELLRNSGFYGLKFRRQHPFSTYIADFYCHEEKIVIEIDGGIHNKQKEHDTNRDKEMQEKGITVFRFTNDEVLDIMNFIKKLEEMLSPLCRRGGKGVRRMVPHRLNMSATPIPRTLALTIYGDQDVSVLDEYPAGRKPIHTRVIREDQRVEVYRFIEEEVKQGRQVYWISPLVTESETLDIASATNMRDILSGVFPQFSIGLIHGKMSGKEKDQVMQDFYENKIHILSSTSVVEVGVNNPNATIICIESSERFGLSQLHQFRGRVGRGDDQSYCYLFTTKEYKNDRLKAMEKTNDGFELAEIDLELRGPGEVYGVRQSGIPDFYFADLRDVNLISEIREDIEEWMKGKKEL